MATYTMYWPDWMCDRAREQGLEGQRLRLLWGGHNQDTRFSRFRVGPGDTVVPITAVDGVLYALASLDIVEKTTAEPWLAAHPDDARLRLNGCGSEILVGDGNGAPLSFARAFSGEQLEQWRFDGTDGERPLKLLEKGRLRKTTSLQGVYRVTPETSKLIEATLAVALPERSKGSAADLEEALSKAPADEPTARVLADAWQDAGDLRGEILALELDLARERDLAKAAEMDARHATLMRRKLGLKREAGGFPYRHMMGARGFVEISPKLTLAPGDKRALVTAFHAFATQLIDCEGVSSVELLRHAGMREPGPDIDLAFAALGAKRDAYVTWTRKAPFSIEEILKATGADPSWFLKVEGALRATDGGQALPLQSASQWLGSAPKSELQLRLTDRAVWGSLRAPGGTPLAETRAAELAEALKKAGGEPAVRRKVRTASGDRVETPAGG